MGFSQRDYKIRIFMWTKMKIFKIVGYLPPFLFCKKMLKIKLKLCTIDHIGDNVQIGRHKNLLFAHSRSASVHCSEAPAIPNLLVRNDAAKTLGNNVWVVGWGVVRFAKPLIVNFYVL
jgi:hypothetical protein